MTKRVLVINPNSSETVTRNISDSVARFEADGVCSFHCIGLPEAPPGIETDADVAAVVPVLQEKVQNTEYDAYVLACFSDPGVSIIRNATGKRIFGIGECGYLQAMAVGKMFGIVSILPASTARQLMYLEKLGFLQRLTASIPLNLSVSELTSSELTGDRIIAVGEELKSRGADVIILGCAGMSDHQKTLQERLTIPVIDPILAAVALVTSYFWVA